MLSGNMPSRMMNHIVLFPGLAADERLFSLLQLDLPAVKVISYLSPGKNESLSHYAQRIAATIPEQGNPIFIGVSFGGILAQEVAHYIPVRLIILISSISACSQLTAPLHLLRKFPVYDWLSESQLKKIVLWAGRSFTSKNTSETALFEAMVRDADIQMIRWGIRMTLHWEQKIIPANVIHIHGSRDRLFPASRIPADIIIEGGQHFMIVQRAGEIRTRLLQLLT